MGKNKLICPKCKAEVSDDDIFCPNCNLKLIFTCPKCKAPTHLGPVQCENCGFTLIKLCPECKAKNFAWSEKCRKCSYIFTQNDENLSAVKISQDSKNNSDKEIIKKQENDKKTDNKLKNVQYKEFKVDSSDDESNDAVKKSKKGGLKERLDKITSDDKTAQNYEIKEEAPKKQITFESSKNPKQEKQKKEPEEQSNCFLIYIDFINLDKTFEKYDKDDFKQKVIQNIKTNVKIVFDADCSFVSSHCVMFKFNYTKGMNFLEIANRFDEEFQKFNEILEKTLDRGLSYKFAVTTIDEVRKTKEVNQLKFGSDKDIIVSNGAYSRFNSDLSLIKIASDSYKMVFLDQKPVFEQSEEHKYDKCLEMILNNLKEVNSQIRIISLNAPRGAGKTHLLNEVCANLSEEEFKNYLVFYAQCGALTQISPYGLIQSFFASLFDCPCIMQGEFDLKIFECRVLERLKLDKIDPEKLETLANIIYPLKKDNYENILINKEITYNHLKDVFDYLKRKKNIAMVVDDFDLIDESSYGFLKFLVEDGYFDNNAKMVLGYKNHNSVSMYFQSSKLTAQNCLNISLRNLNTSESKIFIKKILGEDSVVPNDILSQIAYNAQGNIAYIEQILQYLFERKLLFVKDKIVNFKEDSLDAEIPQNLEKCFNLRLEFLKENNLKEYIFLNLASLLGDKLDYKILGPVFELSENDFYDDLARLEKKGFLKKRLTQEQFAFRNSLIWSYCYVRAKEEPAIKAQVEKLLLELNSKITTTPLICPILAQILDNKELAYSLWTNSLRYSSYIGDVNLYTMAQKQSLILLESVKIDNLEYTKNNICERLGKLIYQKNPSDAKDYLTNVIVSLQNTQNANEETNEKPDDEQVNYCINKIIDLSGYLVKATYLTQDYTGCIEIIDNVLKYFNSKDAQDKKYVYELKTTLIKTRKLDALLKLGSWEELSSLVNTEINPVLQKNLNIFSKHKWISQSEIFYAWIESNIILAQSYSQQGSPLALELIEEIDKVLSKEKGARAEFLKIRLAYANASAHTAIGKFDESDAILQEIVTDFSYVIDTPLMVCEWNIISLINKILRNDFETIKDELFEATAFANNSGDEVSKNLLKTLLAFVLLEEKSYLKAIEIATAQMQYFSTKKIAFGALLSWYISAAATAYNKADMYCIEICEKAVKICENAQNNNSYFKILFQELLAKAYLKLNDKENAKIYCDSALECANKNGLLYLQVKLTWLKTTITREFLSIQPDNKKYDYAQNIIRMYNRSIDLSSRLGLDNIIKKIEKELTSFKAHCQLNRIIEDKQI